MALGAGRGRRRSVVAVVGTVVAVAIAATGAGCAGPVERGQRSASEDAAREPAPRFGRTYDGVCLALARARSGDHGGASSVFADRAHQGLHDLAAASSDRRVTARLLEAKSRVERDLAAGRPATQALEDLVQATAEAIGASGQRAPAPCRAAAQAPSRPSYTRS